MVVSWKWCGYGYDGGFAGLISLSMLINIDCCACISCMIYFYVGVL